MTVNLRSFVGGRRWSVLAVGLCLFLLAGMVQGAGQEPVLKPNYAQAMKYSSEFIRQFSYSTSVQPQWIGKSDQFWYSYRTRNGIDYWKVNPKQATKEPLFDRVKLAAALSEATKKPVEPQLLTLSRARVNDEGTKLSFVADEYQYEWDLQMDKLTKGAKAPPLPNIPGFENMTEEQRQRFQEFRDRRDRDDQRRDDQQQDEQQQQQQQQDTQRQDQTTTPPPFAGRGGPNGYRNYSPDRKKYVYAYKHNLYLAEEGKENEAVQLTTDGVEDYSFMSLFGRGGGGFRERFEQQNNQQNQNQNQNQTQNQNTQTNRGGNAVQATQTQSAEALAAAAAERKTRPNVTWSSDSKAFYVTRTDSRGVKELYLVNSLASPRPALEKYKYPMPAEEDVRKMELWWCDAAAKKMNRVSPRWKHEQYSNVHWNKTGDELRFIRRDRPQRNIEFCKLNTTTGESKCILEEGFENANIEFQSARYIDETDEMIWWSERTGWGHFYLYGRDGTFKNVITSGPWRASRVVAVDPKNRIMYFQGNGREPDDNIYFQHLYAVRLDGSGLTLLDPGNANHTSSLSPSRQFVVDNASRVDKAPYSVLRDAQGNQIMELERCDISRLLEVGWKLPETFTVKAADGLTDLHGNMWKPFDFDPSKKYPLIANVYPGPQTEGVTHTFAAHSSTQQLAQLGFIVIQVGHRGGTPARSKAYHRYGYNNLRDYGLADKKAAIEQLAARHPFIDIDRVGIYGHSGGGFMSAAALLQKPYNDFFKAAVASAGNHDNNIYNDNWAERYHGLTQVVVKKENKTTESAGSSATSGSARPDQQTGQEKNGQEKSEQEKDKVDAAKKEGDAGVQKQEEKKDEKQDEKKAEADKSKTDGKEAGKDGKQTETEEVRFEIKVPTNAELAANLKGALLLVHGEIDNNVHPANTMRLVDALIKANKRFDMLILPGKRHGFGDYQPYFTHRMWEFFAEHLMGDRQFGADILEKSNGNGSNGVR